MASWQLQLCSAAVAERDLKTIYQEGITAKTFDEVEARSVFDFMDQYYNDLDHYGEVVSSDLVKEFFPSVDLPDPQQSLKALCNIVKKEKLARDIRQILTDAQDLLDDKDPHGAVELIQETLGMTEEEYASGDVDFGSTAKDAIIEEYERFQSSEGIVGLPFPWPELSNETGGMEAGDLVVIYGIPKSMKTWLAMYMTTYLYQRHGCRALIYSQEMDIPRLRRRVALILSGLDYNLYRKGALSHDDFCHLLEILDRLEEEAENGESNRKLIFTNGMKASGMNLFTLRHKIEVYRPDIVMLDSAYHMSDDMDWKKLTKLTQGIKAVAKETGTRIIAVNQENERKARDKGRGTASVANSPSWIQDCDLGFRTVLGVNDISLHLTAARECRFDGIRINNKPANDFSLIDCKVKSYEDYDKESSGEEDEDEEAKPKKKRRNLKGATSYYNRLDDMGDE